MTDNNVRTLQYNSREWDLLVVPLVGVLTRISNVLFLRELYSTFTLQPLYIFVNIP
jgi:hypothetical protein